MVIAAENISIEEPKALLDSRKTQMVGVPSGYFRKQRDTNKYQTRASSRFDINRSLKFNNNNIRKKILDSQTQMKQYC